MQKISENVWSINDADDGGDEDKCTLTTTKAFLDGSESPANDTMDILIRGKHDKNGNKVEM